MKFNNSGFAFLPILIGIGLLFIGGGAGIVATKKFSTPTQESIVANVSNSVSDEIVDETEQEIIIEDSNQSETEITTKEETATIARTVPTPSPQNTNSSASVNNTQQTLPTTEPVTVATTISEPALPKAPAVTINTEAESRQNDLLKISYDKAKIESQNLTEGIEFVENRYNELLSFRDRGLELCKSRYEMNISSAKSQANSLKQSYLDGRSGFATQPSITGDIDTALAIDLSRIENEYEICKSKHDVDTSVERDLRAIKSEQTTTMRKLTQENAITSLETILTLQRKILTVADKL